MRFALTCLSKPSYLEPYVVTYLKFKYHCILIRNEQGIIGRWKSHPHLVVTRETIY